MAEWSKALVLGTSLCGGVGSNPTTANHFYRYSKKASFVIRAVGDPLHKYYMLKNY